MNPEKRNVLSEICRLAQDRRISFKSLDNDKSKAGLVVEIVKTTLWLAGEVGTDILWKGNAHYIYVRTHWERITSKEISLLLTTVANIGEIHEYKAKHHRFAEELYKQFRSVVKDMYPQNTDVVKINCDNGTVVFGASSVELRPFDKRDNFFYKLNYSYDPDATAPEFQKVLDEALPLDEQMILQEYIASVFFPRFNHQKALLLYGRGGEGKSLIINVISAALGRENVVERSVASLCMEDSRTVADLENKLLNICYEMSAKFNIENFKKLISKEPMTARRLYVDQYTIYDYASLLFACNELPRNIEYTNAYFRRFIILPFLNQIPEEKQDRTLGERIVKNELSGILNWIVKGAERLVAQGYLTKSKLADRELAEYRIDADSVASFIDENNYEKATENKDCMALKYLFEEYMSYCAESNCHACSRKTFSARLKGMGFEIIRKTQGMFVFARKISADVAVAEEIKPTKEWTLDEDY